MTYIFTEEDERKEEERHREELRKERIKKAREQRRWKHGKSYRAVKRLIGRER
jgi:hypothetical protein